MKLSVTQYHRAAVCLQRQNVSLWSVRWAVTRKKVHAWYTDPVDVTDPNGTWGVFCLIMLPCDDYRLLWHGVAMPRGNVLMLSAGHVTVVANGGCRLLLRIAKFSHHTLRHIVTAARTSRLRNRRTYAV